MFIQCQKFATSWMDYMCWEVIYTSLQLNSQLRSETEKDQGSKNQKGRVTQEKRKTQRVEDQSKIKWH